MLIFHRMLTDTDINKLKKVFATKSDLKSELKPINLKLNKLNKFVQSMNRFYDSEVIILGKRTDRIEKHLNLPRLVTAS